MAWVIKLTYRDSQPNGDFAVEYFTAAADAAGAVQESIDLRAAIANITDCTLGRASIENVLVENRTRPAGNVNGEVKAYFPFITAAGKVMQRTIPGFKSALFITGTDLVDMEAGAVATYTSEVIGGTSITDSNGSDIIGVEQAVKTFGQRQK
jgi:hypothetical protein